MEGGKDGGNERQPLLQGAEKKGDAPQQPSVQAYTYDGAPASGQGPYQGQQHPHQQQGPYPPQQQGAPGPYPAYRLQYPDVPYRVSTQNAYRVSTPGGSLGPPPAMGFPALPQDAQGQRVYHQIHFDSATVIVMDRVLVPPDCVECPRFRRTVHPEPHLESGVCTWALATTLCCFAWPLAWLPFCCGCTKDSVFSCPHCHHSLYRIKRGPV